MPEAMDGWYENTNSEHLWFPEAGYNVVVSTDTTMNVKGKQILMCCNNTASP